MKRNALAESRLLLALVLTGILWSAPARGDVVHLKVGTSMEGKILSRNDKQVVISNGLSEMTFTVDRIDRIEESISATYITNLVRRIIETAKNLTARGNLEEALKAVEAGQVAFEKETAGVTELPEELKALRAQLDETRSKAIPPDPNSQKAERLSQSAVRKLDFIDYEGAFRELKEAASLAPNRADIAWRLARVAVQLKDNAVAIEAYRSAVRENPEAYYAEAARPLLNLLKAQGQRLLAERRGNEAVDVYQEILLIEGATPGAPTDLAEYISRRTLRESKPEEEVLMEVYRYADGNDLVDLAFAAITRVAEKKPDDAEVAKLASKSRFFSALKARIDAKDTDGAAEMLANAPSAVSSEEDAARIRRMAGDLDSDLEARKILAEARKQLDAGRYPEARQAGEASEIIAAAELEGPASGQLEAARAHVAAQRYDEAEEVLDKALATPGIEKSRLHGDLTALKARMPDEREAERVFRVAEVHLERKEHDQAQARLEELASSYAATVAGGKAVAWLAENRKRLTEEIRTTQLVNEYSFFSFADPNLWRAAAYPAGTNSGMLPPVDPSRRDGLWVLFKEMATVDAEATRDRRNPIIYLVVPALAVLAILLALLWKNAKPGKGKLKEPESTPISSDGPPLASGEFRLPEFGAVSCKMCGLPIPEDALVCGLCGNARQMSALEKERAEAMERQADFDPWDMRVKAKTANNYEPHFRKAQDLAQTNDLQSAIEECRAALHEDPQRKEGYLLLADLNERVGNNEDAATCYREVLLLDPAEVIVRQKVQKLLQLSAQPLRMTPLIVAVSGLAWWCVYWLATGVDFHWWLARAGLALLGWGLTALVWVRSQSRQRIRLRAKDHADPDVHRPLPGELLTWREQRRQAQHIAQAINDHIGVEVPLLTPWRIVWTAVLSFLFFAALLGMAWVARSPWILLAWPGGTAVFYYLLVIQPRLFVASVILRHIYEETSSPWVDPHRPFKPHGGSYAGEFLIRAHDEVPLQWARNPFPYSGGAQGILNSIQQTLNRHWACHRFYEGLHTVQDADVPYPGGRRLVWPFALLAMSAAIVLSAWMLQGELGKSLDYSDAMNVGYHALMAGETARAGEEFQDAIRIYPNRAMPHLYMAHLASGMGHRRPAERAFAAATRVGGQLPAISNDFGNFLQREGRMRDAIRQYEVALIRDGKNADVLSNIGSAHFKLREYPRAAEYLERAVAADPNHTRAWTTLGLALEELGMREKGLEAYDNAIRVAPDLAYTNVARDRRERGAQGGAAEFTLAHSSPAN